MTIEERIDYWKGIIEKYRESDLSVAEFWKEHNISTGRFYHWRRRFSNEHCKEDIIRTPFISVLQMAL